MRQLAGDPAHYVRRMMSTPNGAGSRYRVNGLGALTQIGSGSTVSSAAAGASMGASIGSAVPIVGTAIGALVGGAVGAIMSAFNRQDKENVNFSAAQTLSQQQGASAVLNITNKYLVLAGLFDLTPSQIKGNIPIYKKYGRMGEQRFVLDMCAVVQNAANAGQITNNDTPQSVFTKVVQPWINSFGYGAMSDSNADMINYIIMGMIAEYCANIYASRWYAVGGQMPFGSLPPFSLPQPVAPAQPQVTASPTPSPQAVAPAPTAAQLAAAALTTELQNWQSGVQPTYGTSIHYAKTVGGNFLQLPSIGTFESIDSTNAAWIFTLGNSATHYEIDASGTINSWPPAPQATASPTASAPTVTYGAGWNTGNTASTQPVQPTVSATDANGSSIPAQYIPATGSYAPVSGPMQPVTAAVTASASGITPDEMMIGAAVALGFLFMMSQRGAR